MSKLIYAIRRIKKVSIELTSDVVLVWWVFYTCSVPKEAKLSKTELMSSLVLWRLLSLANGGQSEDET